MKASTETLDLQNKIALHLADSITSKWDFITISYEREEDTEGYITQDTLALVFVEENRSWRRISVEAPYACCSLLAQLSRAMVDESNKTWGTCKLEIDRAGKYRFTFNYESPKRLNGLFDDESLLRNYLPQPI